MQSRAAIRYAKAIYEIADEENFIKEIFNDMIRINKLNRDSFDFKNLLSNSIIDNFDNELKNFKQICPKEMLDKLSNPLSLKNKLSKAI